LFSYAAAWAFSSNFWIILVGCGAAAGELTVWAGNVGAVLRGMENGAGDGLTSGVVETAILSPSGATHPAISTKTRSTNIQCFFKSPPPGIFHDVIQLCYFL
jgi:hypothetical protein